MPLPALVGPKADETCRDGHPHRRRHRHLAPEDLARRFGQHSKYPAASLQPNLARAPAGAANGGRSEQAGAVHRARPNCGPPSRQCKPASGRTRPGVGGSLARRTKLPMAPQFADTLIVLTDAQQHTIAVPLKLCYCSLKHRIDVLPVQFRLDVQVDEVEGIRVHRVLFGPDELDRQRIEK